MNLHSASDLKLPDSRCSLADFGWLYPRLLLAFVFLSLTCDLPASTGPDPDPHFDLDVGNGSGSGRHTDYDEVDISASPPADGFEFIQWIQVEGDGSIEDMHSATTVYLGGEENATVVALFAKVDSWFPPGPEENTEGVLLPANPQGSSARMEHKVRVTTDQAGEAEISHKDVFDLVKVRFEWTEEADASYFDVEEAGSSITSGSNLPGDKFEEEGEGKFVLSMWYQGSQQPAAEESPPDVETTFQLVANNKDIGEELTASLLPIEMKVVDRDDPKKKWSDATDHSSSKPIYAGESGGDMVSWKLGGTDSWSSTVFTWTAEGPGGETITGPTGAGKNEWTINDDDQDTATNWLKWKPGKWKIKVQIGSTQAEFEQEVGWRTEDYVVIGQIVPTNTHDGDAPPLVAVGDNFWEISSPVALYRRAVLYDMLDLPVFDGIPDAARDTLMVTPLPITAKLSEAWFGYWYLVPPALTPKGPFTQAFPSGNGNVQYGHRFWALQHVFNVSPDAPLVPQTFSDETFDTIKADEQYRVIHRYKSKFLVTEDGKIDSGKVVQIEHVAEGGPTKMNFGIAAGEFSPIWDNPAYTFFSLPKQPSETNQYQGAHAVSQDGTKLTYYATGRVGPGGQNVNWRLMGEDAPWIFSEIIVELKADRTVAAQIKASVDKSWDEATGAVQGETAFNNLNFYKLQKNLQTDEYEFDRQELLPMEGELEPFINSASGQRPEPPIPPSVQ